jgi:hypothetical protein
MLGYNISKFFEHPFREDLTVKITFIFSIVINLITWAALYFKLHPFSYTTDAGQIYLHYNLYFGIDNIGYWYEALVIPLLGLFIIIFNNTLGYFFYVQEKVISYSLVISQAVLQVILLAAAIFVILLNI